MSCLDVSACFASVSSYFTTMKMRHVGLAVVHCPKTRRVLLVTSRKHPNLWISELKLLQAHRVPHSEGEADDILRTPRLGLLPNYSVANAVPKGGVEKGETSGEAAAREAHEEAGIPASIPEEDISSELCTIEGAKPGSEIWHVHAVALDSEKDLDSDWKERHERKRQWCSHKEALKLIQQWERKSYEFDEGIDEEADEDAWKRGGSKKKRAKGEAFEQALYAFVKKFGYDEKF